MNCVPQMELYGLIDCVAFSSPFVFLQLTLDWGLVQFESTEVGKSGTRCHFRRIVPVDFCKVKFENLKLDLVWRVFFTVKRK